jgi:hypothetical protein
MKRWILFAVLVLGLTVLTSGVEPREGAEAYIKDVHSAIAKYAMQLWPPGQILEIRQYAADINAGARHEDDLDHVWDYYGTNGECVTITHFWDPDNGPGDIMHAGLCNGENAAWKAQILWGMALGEYHSGDKPQAYEYLGHIVHLLGDMSVPTHAHDDQHANPDTFDDEYMNMGGSCDPPVDPGNECLTEDEKNGLIAAGPVEIPDGPLLPLYWLFYTQAQIAGFYASDGTDGNADDPYDPDLVNFSALEYVEGCGDSSVVEGDWEHGLCAECMQVIRRNSYFHSIRAVAALYKLFDEQSKQQAELTLVIDSVQDLQGHGEDPDYFVRVEIGDMWFRNEGTREQDVCEGCTVNPGWAFARNVGLSGTAEVKIELWDDDGGNDDHSDIYNDPDGEERSLWLTVDLVGCMGGVDGAVSGDLAGACGAQLTSAGDDDDRSQIWFRILAPNAPPTADAGPDQTVDEGDLVTLNGSFTDPNVGDTHTFLWHLESSTNGQAVPDATTQSLSFSPVDNGVYTFSFTVTDSHDASGTDTVVVTALNVPPVASIDSLTDEYDEGPGHPTPVALRALDVVLEGSFTDDGIADTHTASLDWGDGEVYTQTDFDSFSDSLGGFIGMVAATHAYLETGTLDITFTVTDDDTGEGAATVQIEVIDAATAGKMAIDDLRNLAQSGPPFWRARGAIGNAVGKLEVAVKLLEWGKPYGGLTLISYALDDLAVAESRDLTLDLSPYKEALAGMAKSEAYVAIAQAGDGPGMAEAEQLANEGDALLAAGNYRKAVDTYRLVIAKCWRL